MPHLATMPLDKLPILSLDLETTGLNTRQDRVLQIGLTDLTGAHQSEQFVKPDIPIPETSTAIHGITEEDVANAPPFGAVFTSYQDLIQDKVLIGYNIGFDLAVLDAETDRYAIEWRWQSALCLRQLATIALGNQAMLVMGDLDTLASHYGIATDNRHSALGDAIISAKLFTALLPDLKEKQILTLGDARRAVAALDDQRIAMVRAGWVDVASLQDHKLHASPLARIDPYPYQHRIGDMMHKDPLVLSPEDSLHDAAKAMQKTGHDCAFVGKDHTQIDGIISERDIVQAMALPLSETKTARALQLKDKMSSPVICVSDQDFMHIALGRLHRHDIRHLGVTGADGALLGWLSTRELIRQRVTDAITIGDDIKSAKSGSDMAPALASLPSLAASLMSESVSAADIAAVISGEYRNVLARSAALAEAKMQQDIGPAPRPFAVLMLGSGGRDESLLAADQDHALIYDDKTDPIAPDDRQAIQNWFESFGRHLSDEMHDAGIPYCKGGVMSSQAAWCQSLTSWRKTISDWCRKARPEDLLSVDIFFDFALVYGDGQLANRLQQAITGRAATGPQFLKLLARSVDNHSAGTTLFGKLKTTSGRFQIKLHVMLPLIETVRVLAISRQMTARKTSERAKALFETKTIPAEILHYAEDLQFCLSLVLRQQIADIAQGLPAITDILPESLSNQEAKRLKQILGRISRANHLLQDSLF